MSDLGFRGSQTHLTGDPPLKGKLLVRLHNESFHLHGIRILPRVHAELVALLRSKISVPRRRVAVGKAGENGVPLWQLSETAKSILGIEGCLSNLLRVR